MSGSVWSGLDTRNRLPEIMDQPGLDPREHARALRGLKRINALSHSVSSLYGPIRRLALLDRERPLQVLEIASGGGDTAIALARRAQRDGLRIEVTGSDVNPQAVAIATERARELKANVRFSVEDALREGVMEVYDVVTCSLFLHHLDAVDAVTVLHKMKETARRMVLVDDLVRSRLGYALAWAGCRVLSRSPVVHYDGPVSVAGAYSVLEVKALAEQAALFGASVKRRWPERFLLTWKRDATH